MLVPQLAQLSAPTAARAFGALVPLLSPSAPPSAPSSLADDTSAGGVDPATRAAGEEGVSPWAAAVASSSASASKRADTASALLYVGHPEQADVPPVPSHRPSPGQVPPPGLGCGTPLVAGAGVVGRSDCECE